jgi:hypothetical protein
MLAHLTVLGYLYTNMLEGSPHPVCEDYAERMAEVSHLEHLPGAMVAAVLVSRMMDRSDKSASFTPPPPPPGCGCGCHSPLPAGGTACLPVCGHRPAGAGCCEAGTAGELLGERARLCISPCSEAA